MWHNPVAWIIAAVCLLALGALAVLAVAAVLGSRSQSQQTPTQKTENPYRKVYNDEGKDKRL